MWPDVGMSANAGIPTNTRGLFEGNERGRMYLEIQVCLTSLHLNMADLWLCHRFTTNELLALVAVLRIPDPLITPNCYQASALEALALTCTRLHSPEDQWTLVTKYCQPQSAISQITHEVILYINKAWGHLLQFNFNGVLSPQVMTQYAVTLQ